MNFDPCGLGYELEGHVFTSHGGEPGNGDRVGHEVRTTYSAMQLNYLYVVWLLYPLVCDTVWNVKPHSYLIGQSLQHCTVTEYTIATCTIMVWLSIST